MGTSSLDLRIKIWDFEASMEKNKLTGMSESILSMCFDHYGSGFFSSHKDGYVRMWDCRRNLSSVEYKSELKDLKVEFIGKNYLFIYLFIYLFVNRLDCPC